MSTTRKIDKWLLVQWKSGGRSVVNSKVIGLQREPKLGTVVAIPGPEGERLPGTIIGNSRDRDILEQQVTPRVYGEAPEAGPSGEPGSAPAEESGDFSASDSDDWAPSGAEQESSEDDDDEEIESKRSKMDRSKRASTYRRTSKILKPSHRADAINKIILNNRKRTMETRKSLNTTNKTNDKKSLPDSTRKNHSPTPASTLFTKNEMIDIDNRFKKLFRALKVMKLALQGNNTNVNNANNKSTINNITKPVLHKPSHNNLQKVMPRIVKAEKAEVNNVVNNEMHVAIQNDGNDDEYCFHSDDSRRSEDNVLITNKYNTSRVITSKKVLTEEQKNTKQKKALDQKDEWIPIGSGQTLIHRDQYRDVNWKTYTVATRTLLMAVFPRKILATHSLTGKPSPAFMNKPAKMLLNPKIVSDIVIEVADRFHVKDNLVRTVITTKCADESKMYRMRMKRRTLPQNEDQENVSPMQQRDPNHTL